VRSFNESALTTSVVTHLLTWEKLGNGKVLGNLVEAIDHSQDVRRVYIFVLFCPPLVKKFPGLDGFVQIVFQQSQLSCDFL
jgi:hypothetical protein